MGFGKLTKSIGSAPPVPKKPFKQSFGSRGTAEQTTKAPTSTPQHIEDYDYNPVDPSEKGLLRRDKLKQQGRDIFNNAELTEEDKSFRLQQLINQEKIHQDKFKPDKERKQHLRDQVLNKTEPSRQKIGEQWFDKRTDGKWWTED